MDEALGANRMLWDALTRINVTAASFRLDDFENDPNEVRLRDYEREDVGDVSGKSLLHLQCHFGVDTLSWARLGASVTGADFSAAAIAAAREVAAELDIAATFVESELDVLPDNLAGQFDIVYTSRGVLGWLPDIDAWARVVAHFVKPGGFFYITEIHPVALVFEDRDVQPGELRLAFPYWSHRQPLRFEVQGSYADRDAPTPGLVEHVWNRSLGEIVTALIDAGLRIEFLHEFDFVDWAIDFLVESEDGRYRLPPETKGDLPLYFSLKATQVLDDAGALK